MLGVYRVLKRIYDNVTTALFVVIILCVALQIFARYVARVSIPWTEELARYMLIIVSFLGAGMAFRRGLHLGAYFLRDKAKGKILGIIFSFNSLVIAGVLCMMLRGAFIMRSAVLGLDSSTMTWFMQSWLYEAAIIGLIVMLGYAIRDVIFSVMAAAGKKKITGSGSSCPFPDEEN
jgi:TRAP-type C4-dicarboxylate transport system permease small subunit